MLRFSFDNQITIRSHSNHKHYFKISCHPHSNPNHLTHHSLSNSSFVFKNLVTTQAWRQQQPPVWPRAPRSRRPVRWRSRPAARPARSPRPRSAAPTRWRWAAPPPLLPLRVRARVRAAAARWPVLLARAAWQQPRPTPPITTLCWWSSQRRVCLSMRTRLQLIFQCVVIVSVAGIFRFPGGSVIKPFWWENLEILK